MEKLLIKIKHNIPFLWTMIEFVNELIIKIVFKKKIDLKLIETLSSFSSDEFYVKKLSKDSLETLYMFIKQLDENEFEYFKPHKMDKESLSKVLRNDSLIKLGFYEKDSDKLIGYFILRLFFNKKCFIGRLVHPGYRGKGIAGQMAKIFYCIAKKINFNIYSTISKKNIPSLKSHKKVMDFSIVKELKNDFYLIKFNLDNLKC